MKLKNRAVVIDGRQLIMVNKIKNWSFILLLHCRPY